MITKYKSYQDPVSLTPPPKKKQFGGVFIPFFGGT